MTLTVNQKAKMRFVSRKMALYRFCGTIRRRGARPRSELPPINILTLMVTQQKFELNNIWYLKPIREPYLRGFR